MKDELNNKQKKIKYIDFKISEKKALVRNVWKKKKKKLKLKEQKNSKKNKKNNSMNHVVLIINLHSRK